MADQFVVAVVDDDPRLRQLILEELTDEGVTPIPCETGQHLLDLLQTQTVDLVFLDLMMPGMDGYRATAEIRKSMDSRKRDVPIIALTASAFLTEKEKAVLFGMNDHVGKPFSPDELTEKILNCLATYKGIGQ